MSTPFIWVNLIWIVVADFVLELYHHTCFPLYELPLVERKKYIRIDRHKLSYLNILEKVACVYCGYANGWLKYASEIAAQTEKYWCGIKHQNVEGFIAPEHHKEFVEYGDKQAFLNAYSTEHSTDTADSYSEEK